MKEYVLITLHWWKTTTNRMNSEPLVNHCDSMAKEISHTVAISNSYTFVPDCLSSLSSIQFNDKHITFTTGKFSFKFSVQTTLKITGKWTSPSGYLKLFTEASNEVVISYYLN